MRLTLSIIIILLTLCSCNEVKNKTKKVINKTGTTVGKAGSEFANGIADGVSKTFQSTITLSEDLQKRGVSFGKFAINKHTHTVSVYLIFDSAFRDTISAKVFDKAWNEYGRCQTMIDAQKDGAQYYDLKFSDRTDFENNSNIVLE